VSRRLLVAAVVLVAAARAQADPAPAEHGAVSLGLFSGYLSQLDVHIAVFPVQPLVVEAMFFRGYGTFFPGPDSLPRDGGGLSLGARSHVLTVGRIAAYLSGLFGYRAVLLRDDVFMYATWYHGVVLEGVGEILFRVGPTLALGLRFASGLLFFPGQDAPYFTYSARGNAGGLAPEWQLGLELGF
jgi:hypothetical protein